MKSTKVISSILALIVWFPIIFFSVLLAHNAMLYFTHGGEYGILTEKTLARQDPIWNIAFYLHLPAGILCMFAPVIPFSRLFVKKALNLHRYVGKLYMWITLALVCPTGMYLALYAKGGFVTQAGFMMQGILLAIFTYMSYNAIAKGNTPAHRSYMIRSYAMALTVLTFRIYHILFFLWDVPYQQNYAISQWLGMAGNMLLAELIIVFIDSRSKHRSSAATGKPSVTLQQVRAGM